MNYTLTLRVDTLTDEDGLTHTVYGVNVTDRHGTTLAIPDISFRKAVVRRLIALCRQEQVELCHLPDVVQDTITEQYLT